MDFTLEVIGFSIESCAIAQAHGAHRIELCDNPEEGGTTASYGFLKAARKLLTIELYPIIRPRGGDFLYSDEEFMIMQTDVEMCKHLGSDGVVIGMLREDGTVDADRCARLVELAYPLGVTFHRAFDRAAEPFSAMETIIGIGCERILTSGQQPTAIEGAELIAALITKADERISIMPGSGVRADTIGSIAQITGAIEFHTSARIQHASNMIYQKDSMREELRSTGINAAELDSIIASLRKIPGPFARIENDA